MQALVLITITLFLLIAILLFVFVIIFTKDILRIESKLDLLLEKKNKTKESNKNIK
jgi:low affinity Fe/Cu permease